MKMNRSTWMKRTKSPRHLETHCLPHLLSLCILLFLSACGTQESSKLEDFAQDFREANSAPGVQPMLALYELDGSTEQTVNLLKNALLYELGLPIRSIEFEPLSGAPEETIQYAHQGIEYGSTLKPLMRMRVSYQSKDGYESLFTIGRNQAGDWRIASSRPVEVAP
jgi:hypothetical protein